MIDTLFFSKFSGLDKLCDFFLCTNYLFFKNIISIGFNKMFYKLIIDFYYHTYIDNTCSIYKAETLRAWVLDEVWRKRVALIGYTSAYL